MTGRAKAKKDDSGKWLKNGAGAKSGLNKAILNVGWHRFEEFLKYKANRAGKA
jgi:putative transposase